VTYLRLILFIVFTIFPLAYGDVIKAVLDTQSIYLREHDGRESLNWPFLVMVILATLMGLVEAHHDRKVREQQEERQKGRLAFQGERALTMGRLIELFKEMTLIVSEEEVSSQDKVSRLDSILEEVLKAVCQEVRAYHSYRGREDLTIRANVMIPYPSDSCPRNVQDRLKFRGYGRDVTSYRFILWLLLWSEQDPEVAPIALPVEDTTILRGRNRLLPGAPAAFALGQDFVIQDTSKIEDHVAALGPDLEPDVLQELRDYCREMPFRSFASLVLKAGEKPIAVLNIQSSLRNVFGEGAAEEKTVASLIGDYRIILQHLLLEQLKLQGMAS
jgi:hypothetical protein